MKKIYFVPELNVVKIRQCCLLQVSVQGEEGLNEGSTPKDAGDGLSRSFSFGDDE